MKDWRPDPPDPNSPGKIPPPPLVGPPPILDPPPASSSSDSPDARTLTDDFASPSGETLRIGPYKILQKLGEGGMGEVYHAEQREPVRRPVALKLIKLGMDTKQVVARFESERQALALLNHPNIAHVLDAGSTPEGRPYFVMEFVQGVPITKYCQEQRLSIQERLRLFCEVCEGVQHAHQKGIIHRDLKPSNILVTVQDKRPVAKIIDFGVAKATAQRLTERTLVTEIGYAVGTLGYMSPEQAGVSALDIDTRSDVYSLGVVLYELLVGEIPFGPEKLRALGIEAYVRDLKEKDPPRPSTRLSAVTEEAGPAARERRPEVDALRRQIRGDLDWIVLKALEKDRTRRYGSASDLAEDIRRHTRHEPVAAGPPNTLYRVLKFVRRNRVGVSAVSVVFLALVAGIVGTSLGLMRAVRAERHATREAETARRVTDFLVGLFEVSDPDSARGSQVTAREILDEGSKQIREELADEPLVRARLMGTMGNVYKNLGLYRQAESNFSESVSLLATTRGAEPVNVVRTLNQFAHMMTLAGRYSESEQLGNRALRQGTQWLGNDHVDVGWSMYFLGSNYVLSGRPIQGVAMLEPALKIFRATLGPNNIAVAWCLNDIAIANMKSGGGVSDAGVSLFEESARIKEHVLGPKHRDVAMAWSNAGYTHGLLGHYDEAERFIKRAIDIYNHSLGPAHPATAQAMHSLGEAYRRKGDPARASAVLLQALEIQTAALGPEHTDVALTLSSLAAIHSGLGENVAADREFHRALAIYEKSGGLNNVDIIFCLEEYAKHMDRMGRTPEAARARSRVEDARRRASSTETEFTPEIATP